LFHRHGHSFEQICTKFGKGKERYLYRAILYYAQSQSTHTWITQFYLQITPFLPFLRKRSLDGATPNWGSRHPIAAHRRDEMLIWPGWLTYSGQFTHLNSQSSAAGRAQDRESSPVKDQRSSTVSCKWHHYTL